MAWYNPGGWAGYVNPIPMYNTLARKTTNATLGRGLGWANEQRPTGLDRGIEKAGKEMGLESRAKGMGDALGMDTGLGGSSAGSADVKEQLKKRSPWANTTGKKWYELLDAQRAQAFGEAPSLAEAQYRQAQGDTQAALRSAAAGTNRPGMMRASLQQQANVGQGMATGVAQARLQERLAAQAAYAEALKGAGMVEGRDQSTWVQLAQILNGKPAEPSTWDRVAAMAPLLAMMA